MESPNVTAEQASKIRLQFATGTSRNQIVQDTQLSQTVIGQILRGEIHPTHAPKTNRKPAPKPNTDKPGAGRVHNRANARGQKRAPKKNWY